MELEKRVYCMEIKEVYTKEILLSATSKAEALKIVRAQYEVDNIQLNEDDLIKAEFTVLEDRG